MFSTSTVTSHYFPFFLLLMLGLSFKNINEVKINNFRKEKYSRKTVIYTVGHGNWENRPVSKARFKRLILHGPNPCKLAKTIAFAHLHLAGLTHVKFNVWMRPYNSVHSQACKQASTFYVSRKVNVFFSSQYSPRNLFSFLPRAKRANRALSEAWDRVINLTGDVTFDWDEAKLVPRSSNPLGEDKHLGTRFGRGSRCFVLTLLKRQ